jgi:hypothetical protein
VLRLLTRHRDNLIRLPSTHVLHMQKTPNQMNVQLHHVLTILAEMGPDCATRRCTGSATLRLHTPLFMQTVHSFFFSSGDTQNRPMRDT